MFGRFNVVFAMAREARMSRELGLLCRHPPAGVAAWPLDDSTALSELRASIRGPPDTPYEHGEFLLAVSIPDRYPFEPPRVRFITPVYHPNIDSAGRICLDTLKMPPKGSWTPSLNISTVLTTIQALLAAPNPDDALVADISDEFRRTPEVFNRKAREFTLKHASASSASGNNTDEEKKYVSTRENTGLEQPEKAKKRPREDDEEEIAKPAPEITKETIPTTKASKVKSRKLGRI